MGFNTALLLLDLQNDICHQDGILNKKGLTANVSNIISNIIDIIHFCKENNIPIIATQLTVLENIDKEAMGLGIYKQMRPFLEKEGFRFNSWGHDLLEELPKVDFKIRKWGMSSFYQTELTQHLEALEVTNLILTGFTTNGVVETTAREAASRNYKIITLKDCVASYSDTLHHASLTNLSSFGKVLTTNEWKTLISEGNSK